MKKAAVMGAGTMGSQIGLIFAQGGYLTLLHDLSPDRVEWGLTNIKDILSRWVTKGRITAEKAEEFFGRISTTTAIADLKNADFIVEAVFEDIKVKCEVFNQLDNLCSEHTILATNTSTLCVSEIAAATKRADRCIGTHFLIPAAFTPLVEVSRGLDTSDETHRTVLDLLKRCGKETITVDDAPAFVINRLYIPLLNEAFYLLQEGVATPEEIDLACTKGLGFPLGPLSAADASGLDVILNCMESLQGQLGDKYRPAPFLRKLVKAGRLGRKCGKGVYSYKETKG